MEKEIIDSEEGRDDCYFLDEMGPGQLKARLHQAIDRIEEEHRVMIAITHRLAGR